MILNPYMKEEYEISMELMDFLTEVDAQWYVICEQKLGNIYVKHGASLLPGNLVESFINERVYVVYDDGISFCRGDDKCNCRKVVVLLPSLTIYEKVLAEVNSFNLDIRNKQDAIDFIREFNCWVMEDKLNMDLFKEWYEAIEVAEHYLSIDPTPDDKCLIQLCHYYQQVDYYVYHHLKDIPSECLCTEIDEYGVCYTSKRVISVDKELFKAKEYIVKDGIEQIDDDVFESCMNIEHITLPTTLRKIGANVFHRCDSLQELSLPENVNEIGECLCEHSKNLKRVVLPDKIKHIKIASFYCCDSLEEVKLPANLRTLSDNVFAYTPALKHLELPDTLFWIGGECFWKVVIKELKIPKHTRIADDAFLESNVKIEYV